MIGRKAIVAGVKKVGQDPPKIKVDKTRPVAEQKRPAGQHLLERNEQGGQVGEQRLLAGAPLLEAAAAELAFLVPEMAELLGGRDEFPVIHVVQFKAQPFHFVLDVAPEDALQAVPLRPEKAQVEFGVEIFGDDLRIVVRFEQDVASVLQDGDLVVALFGQTSDQGTVPSRNVDDFMRVAAQLQNAPLHQAVGTPGKLNEFEHE